MEMMNPLREWALNHELTNSELAILLGISLRHFSGIISGERMPSAPVLFEIQEMSCLSWNELMPVFRRPIPPRAYSQKKSVRRMVFSPKHKTWFTIASKEGRLWLYIDADHDICRPQKWKRVRAATEKDMKVFMSKGITPVSIPAGE